MNLTRELPDRATHLRRNAGRKLILEDSDRAGLRAGVKANPAAGAAVALVFTEVIPLAVESIAQPQAAHGTGFDAQAASFAFLLMYLSPTAVFLFFAFGHIDRLHWGQSAGHGMRLNRQLACLQSAVRHPFRKPRVSTRKDLVLNWN